MVRSVEVVQPESDDRTERSTVKVDNSKVITNFIDDGRLRKERKEFTFLNDRVIVNQDTIFVDSKKDSTFVGYDVIDFPYKQVRPHTIKKTSNGVKIDNINYYVNLPLSRKKIHIIEAGQTRSKLLKLGIPEQYIPDIPTIGTKIEYYE